MITEAAHKFLDEFPEFKPIYSSHVTPELVDVHNNYLIIISKHVALPLQTQIMHRVNLKLMEAWSWPDNLRTKLFEHFGTSCSLYITNDGEIRSSIDELSKEYEPYTDDEPLFCATYDGLDKFFDIMTQDEIGSARKFVYDSERLAEVDDIWTSAEYPYELKAFIPNNDSPEYVRTFKSYREAKFCLEQIKINNNFDELKTWI